MINLILNVSTRQERFLVTRFLDKWFQLDNTPETNPETFSQMDILLSTQVLHDTSLTISQELINWIKYIRQEYGGKELLLRIPKGTQKLQKWSQKGVKKTESVGNYISGWASQKGKKNRKNVGAGWSSLTKPP